MTLYISRRGLLTGSAASSLALAAGPSYAGNPARQVGSLFRHLKDRPAAPFGDKVSGRIVNYNRISPNLGTSGLLLPGGLEEAIALGFRTVIDLRGTDENGVAEEAEHAERLGITRRHIPITTRITPQGQIDQFTKIVENADNYPVLAHCVSANRVSGMWALYRAQKGVEPIIAIEEARGSGLTSREPAIRNMLGLPPAET